MIRFLIWLTGYLPCRIINGPDGEPYLERYFLFRCLGVTAFIHRFVADDPDRGLHDHPWGWAASLVLVGGYYEQRLKLTPNWQVQPLHPVIDASGNPITVCMRFIWPWQINLLRGDDFHRITLRGSIPVQAWTLFVHGPRRKGWGFLKYTGTPSGHRYQRYEPFTLTRVAAFDRWWKTAPCGHEQRRNTA